MLLCSVVISSKSVTLIEGVKLILGVQCKTKINDGRKLCDLYWPIQGETWGPYP